MKKILIALLMTVLFQSAQAFDYANTSVRVKWTDAEGANRENLLTDRATDPRHIIALLQELYCNYEVPGNKNVDGIGNNGPEDGFDVIYGNKWTNPKPYLGREVERYPNEDRFTCILVELKDGATELPTTDNVEDFEKTVKAVTLIPSVAESINLPNQYGKDSQYILSITGSYDNFYFAAKGKPRKGAKCGNWERLSATEYGQKGTDGFFNAMVDGETYKVTHDADDIVADGHYISINPGGNPPYMKHLTLVVPKNRFAAWDGRDIDGEMTWYHPDHCPYIGLYLIKSMSSSVTRTNQWTLPTVTLKWSTNLRTADGLNFTGAEKSDLYLVNEDGTETLVNTLWHTNDYNNEFEYTFWNVEMSEVGRYLRYKVVCYTFDERDANGPHATEAESYITVYIPGKKDEFNCEYSYRSRFEESVNKNSYKNTFALKPMIISGNGTRTLRRTNADGSNAVDVATIALNGVDANNTSAGTYVVTYNNAMNPYTQLRYDNKALVTNGNVKDGIEINDYFFADTQNGGDLSGGYVYTIVGGAEGLNLTKFEVPVYAADVASAYNTQEYHINDMTNDMGRFANGKSEDNLDLTKCASISMDDVKGNVDDITNYGFYDNGEKTLNGVQQLDDVPTGLNRFTGELSVRVGDVVNTYGTNSVNVEVPAVEVNFEQIESGRDEAKGISSFGVTLNIKPTLAASVAPYVYYYRVWRVEEGENMEKTVTLINNEADKHGATWATSYSNIKSQFPCGDAKSSNADVMRVRDIFQRPIDKDHESRMVSYVVRMYTTTDYQDQGLEMAAALGGDDDIEMFNPLCMISECENVVTFSNLIVTGVNDVTAQKQVSSVRYVNMLGMESNRPFEGINVVVTTYTDGTQSTTKMRK